ncbi:MAG: site-2 protease family protein, partial [Muribaculaceae bacterium]|nr:site-2 protease family protein [Muribaculaceae bacterium]
MDTFLIKAAQLILALAFLIIVHEFGHFLFARIFGVKVEKFYIFFDPWKEIFKWKPKKYYGFFGSHHKLEKGADEQAAN